MVHTTPVGCLIGTCIAADDRCSSSSPATRGAIVGWLAELEPRREPVEEIRAASHDGPVILVRVRRILTFAVPKFLKLSDTC